MRGGGWSGDAEEIRVGSEMRRSIWWNRELNLGRELGPVRFARNDGEGIGGGGAVVTVNDG